ncbi:MAG: VOC family protein [Anaerolineae bacterium]
MPSEPQGAMPSLVGVNHVGYAVPDICAARDFFVNVLGFEIESQPTTLQSADDDRMARFFDIHPRGTLTVCFLRAPDGSRVELLQPTAPDAETTMPKNSDVGARHLALSVSDLEAAVAFLAQQPGVRLMEMNPGVQLGERRTGRFAYFATPFGMYIQLVAV